MCSTVSKHSDAQTGGDHVIGLPELDSDSGRDVRDAITAGPAGRHDRLTDARRGP